MRRHIHFQIVLAVRLLNNKQGYSRLIFALKIFRKHYHEINLQSRVYAISQLTVR